ncbi:hypothetical protein ONZ45_g356 [Pleurotus djamor]|nr:hypothetical protein ONZ45_g356 [Pleurotus djamor]
MWDFVAAYVDRFHSACVTASKPLADALGVAKLPDYASTIALFFFVFLTVHQVVAPSLSQRWFPVAYGTSNRRGKNNWSIHVVSQVHALLIIPWAWRCLWLSELESDKISGWHRDVGILHAIACGYFVWDTLDAVVNFVDIGFVIHGFACSLIYLLAYKPFVAYYGVRCLFWETSTIFLNIHWFLDKTGRTGTKLQLVNGVLLISSFFFIRLVWGGYISYSFLVDLYRVRNEVPPFYVFVYGVGNIVLQSLNWLWFTKMIAALRKRFVADAPNGKAPNGKASNGKASNGKASNGKLH